MEIRFPFGVEIKASGRTVIAVILVAFIVGALIWHDYKSTNSFASLEKAVWYQTAVLLIPEAERKKFAASAPAEVKEKLDKQINAERGE